MIVIINNVECNLPALEHSEKKFVQSAEKRLYPGVFVIEANEQTPMVYPKAHCRTKHNIFIILHIFKKYVLLCTM